MSQGYPWQRMPAIEMETFTEAFLHDLAGNAFAAPLILAVVLAGLGAVDRWRTAADDGLDTEAKDSKAINSPTATLLAHLLWPPCLILLFGHLCKQMSNQSSSQSRRTFCLGCVCVCVAFGS